MSLPRETVPLVYRSSETNIHRRVLYSEADLTACSSMLFLQSGSELGVCGLLSVRLLLAHPQTLWAMHSGPTS